MTERRVRVEAILREAAFMTKPAKMALPVSGFVPGPGLNPKFARKLSECDQSDRPYSTRSGLLNPTHRKQTPGGNNYCSILRQKKQASELTSLQSSIVKDSELYTEPPSLLCTRGVMSPLSKSLSCSLFNSRKQSPYTSPRKAFALPKAFGSFAIQCECEVGIPCTCGKRTLSEAGTEKWLEELCTKCSAVTRETQQSKHQLDSQRKYVKERLQVCARQTTIVLRTHQRAEHFRLRQRMHDVSRRLKALLAD